MAFVFRPLDWSGALTAARWHYPKPYDLYDLGRMPLLISVALDQILSPLGRIGFYAVQSGDDPLVGIFSFRKIGRALELGLALRPDLTGHGAGLDFVQAGMQLGRDVFAPAVFRLDVATFNQRAIRVYERAGFLPGRRFMRSTRLGLYQFMEMSQPA